jgi:hypothetical protein
MTLNNSMSITPSPPGQAKRVKFEHGSVLGGKTRSARVSSQWKSTSFIRINWKGDIVCVAGAAGYSANPFRVRLQLEPRENPELRNEFCRSIIMRKIEATIITLEKSIPRSDKWERTMRSA